MQRIIGAETLNGRWCLPECSPPVERGFQTMPTLHFGRDRIDVEIATGQLLAVHRQPPVPPLAHLAAVVRAAVEAPLGFPALRRALTPDDHVAVVIDESLPHLGQLLAPLLEHISSAGVAPEAITLVSTKPAADQGWLEDLPDAFEEVRIEVHDPKERKDLAYLATTRRGRRIYLNRTVVDADQLVVLGRPDVDPLFRRGGAGLLYPALGDEAACDELATLRNGAQALRQEAAEIAWLLGAPFLVQVVEGMGDNLAHVITGPVDTSDEGVRLYERAGDKRRPSWPTRSWPPSAAIRPGSRSPTWPAPWPTPPTPCSRRGASSC